MRVSVEARRAAAGGRRSAKKLQIYVNPWRAGIGYGYAMTRTSLAPVSITAEELAALIAECDALRGELRVTKVERDLLKEQLKAFERRLFGARSEARSANQRDLFLNEAEALAPTGATLPAQEDKPKNGDCRPDFLVVF
jgi:hypothetical protein